MQEEENEVVREVRRQGGLEFARLARLAAEGDEFAAQAALDMAWEQLHCAPWHAVHPAWRDAYALSCLRLAAHRTHDALRLLDMGLLMGGPRLKPRLHSAMAEFQQQQRNSSPGGHSAPSLRNRDVAADDNRHNGGADLAHGHAAAAGQSADVDDDDFGHDDSSKHFLCSTFDGSQRRGADDTRNHPSEVATTILPHGSLCHQEVCRKKLIPVEDFLCDFFIPSRPVIIADAMIHWPAMKKWKNLNYFRDALGDRTVPVEVGEHYLASGWKQELMTMFELLKRFQLPASSSSERPYLAQHPLFEQNGSFSMA